MQKVNSESSLQVDKFNIELKKYNLSELNELIKKNTEYKTDSDIDKLIPKSNNYIISFDLINSFVGFANGIRRILVEELDVSCLTCDDADIITNDEFLLSDKIIKNINLLALNQNLDLQDSQNMPTFKLEKTNKTNKIINVNAFDIKESRSSESRSSESRSSGMSSERIDETSDFLLDDVCILRLRPNRSITINNINIIKGKSKNDAGCFSLLSNIIYVPYGIELYNIETGKGNRSINSNYSKFHFELTTCGNITPAKVFELLMTELFARLNNCLNCLNIYLEKGDSNLKVIKHVSNGSSENELTEYEYRFNGEYLTMAKMISQKCYILDPNGLFITGNINRYDDEVAVIRIKHASPDKLIKDAILGCINDAEIFKKEIEKKLKLKLSL